MFDAHLRFGRLRFEASISWDGPEEEPDDAPPSPVPHLDPLDPLELDGLDDDGDDADDRLGFRI